MSFPQSFPGNLNQNQQFFEVAYFSSNCLLLLTAYPIQVNFNSSAFRQIKLFKMLRFWDVLDVLQRTVA